MTFKNIILLFSLTLSTFAAELNTLDVTPREIKLDHKNEVQGIVIQGLYDDGTTQDLESQVKVKIINPEIATYRAGSFIAIKDGSTTAQVTYEGQTVELKISASNTDIHKQIRFSLDVMPIFTKAGCNSGGCHGASRGKDKFRLALFGYDPDGDYERLTTEFPGRRINLAVPEDSMLITKSLNTVPHTGGKLFEKDSFEYTTIINWLEDGAQKDPKDIKLPVKLEVFPQETVLQGQSTQKISVRVTYSDGTDRDVSNLTTYVPSDSGVVFVNKDGRIENKNFGEAYLMARFGTLTALAKVISIPEKAETISSLPANNYVDELVNQKLTKLRIKPSQLCDDNTFLRRVYLDTIGRLPSEEEYLVFTNSKDKNKRDLLIDELVNKPEFIDLWVMKWAEILKMRSENNFSYKSTLLYYNWLRKKFSENVPIDQVVKEMLSSSGNTFSNPPTNFYQVETDTLKMTENIAQVFMGTRIQCAQCHNHPFDRWTMDDYYSFAGFFAQIGRKNVHDDERARIIYDRRSGGVKHPVYKKDMPPVFLGGEKADVKGKDRREVFANWLTDKNNPYFSRSLINRIWDQFFGRGITHPVDDARLSNPPSNKELLDELAKKLTDYNYDFRKVVKDICSSRTYQLESKTNESNKLDIKNFSHASIRRIRAEVLLDSISQATSTDDKFKSLPKGAKAIQIADGKTSTYFLTTFGRATRETVCSCEVRMEPNLSQALHLLNGDTIQNKIRSGRFIENLLKEKVPPKEILQKLYRRCYSREIKENELNKLMPVINESKNQRETLEDVFWALLNSKEFIFVR
ncbi:MAG: DUF1549 and DUF1553 domain-containing protein [Lentisphaeraceae bacterium]|nr:DUF1549 and DUF1553 domain-containing protein [Lentisphaeraceae bacterium]